MTYVVVNRAVPEHTYTWRKRTAGVERFAEVVIGIEPLSVGSGLRICLVGGAEIPEALRRGALDGMLDGASDVFDLFEPSHQVLGDVRPLALTDASLVGRMPRWHPMETTDDVVRMVAATCVREVVWRAGGPQLLGAS